MKTLIENDYLLLTPGPLSTSPTVRQAMDRDWCTWDEEYNEGVVTPIRQRLVVTQVEIVTLLNVRSEEAQLASGLAGILSLPLPVV